MAAGLGQESPGISEMAQAAGQAVTQPLWACTAGRVERCPQVICDLVEAGPPVPARLGRCLQGRRGLCGPAQVAFPGRGLLTAGHQLLQRVDAHGFQHAPPATLPVRTGQQALVGQPANQVSQRPPADVGRDGAGRVQVKPTDKYAELPEHSPFILAEQVMTPADDRPHRMMPRVGTAPAGQQTQAITRPDRRPVIPSDALRAAASSMASGIPSSRAHSSATSARLAAKSGATARALSRKSVTASESLASPGSSARESGRMGTARSPATASRSWLVASTVTPGQAASMRSVNAATMAARCSQLSSTSSHRPWAR
jgi:hypothetical protein